MKNSMIVLATAGALFLASCSGSGKQVQQESAASATPATAPAILTTFTDVNPAVRTQMKDYISGYLSMSQALIEDNADGARKAAADLQAKVQGFDVSGLSGEQLTFYQGQAETLGAGLKAVADAGDISEIRIALSGISKSVYALVKAYGANDTELYYQYCPMANDNAGANWLSATKEVINPYMGQRMLNCGRNDEVIAAK